MDDAPSTPPEAAPRSDRLAVRASARGTGKIVAVHSFRGGTGKSNVSANIAWLAAERGARVAVLDTDLQSPGVHIVLGVDVERIVRTLSDFVLRRCDISEAAYDVTVELGLEGTRGRLMLLPSSMKLEMISQIIASGYDVTRLNDELTTLMQELDLDLLVIDTHPGLNQETMLTAAIADVLLVLLRPDNQDYQGTAVVLEVAKRLRVPALFLLANKVVRDTDREGLIAKIEKAYEHPVIGVLPLSEDVARAGSSAVFAREDPTHPFAKELVSITERLLAEIRFPLDSCPTDVDTRCTP
jgi:MinD-like ATPase involved in chromosome partitioning or flagellar assembly